MLLENGVLGEAKPILAAKKPLAGSFRGDFLAIVSCLFNTCVFEGKKYYILNILPCQLVQFGSKQVNINLLPLLNYFKIML
jgi:hypothetical protein